MCINLWDNMFHLFDPTKKINNHILKYSLVVHKLRFITVLLCVLVHGFTGYVKIVRMGLNAVDGDSTLLLRRPALLLRLGI